MSNPLRRLMRQATRMTRLGNVGDATRAIQKALASVPIATAFSTLYSSAQTKSSSPTAPFSPRRGSSLDGVVLRRSDESSAQQGDSAGTGGHVGERFLDGSHASAGQNVAYKLYLPPGLPDRPLPLILMLHGCTQNPDDFAVGTAMNERAKEHGCAVLYPAQSVEANPQRCWSWFKRDHQSRGAGEPALLAELTQLIVKQYRLDAGRVYVAGLSAGGAMADIVASAYPDVFAALAVHSGLLRGAATHVTGAFGAMKNGAPNGVSGVGVPAKAPRVTIPTIVFHGDQDQTVSPKNGAQIVAATLLAFTGDNTRYGALQPATLEQGTSAGGRRYTRTVHLTSSGDTVVEEWVIHGSGHAWSGGSAKGSYTDSRGPDASGEMVRFFFRHRTGSAQ